MITISWYYLHGNGEVNISSVANIISYVDNRDSYEVNGYSTRLGWSDILE